VVHAESYIQQTEAVFSGDGDVQSASLTHPENFIRTRALHLWHEQRGGSLAGTEGGDGQGEPLTGMGESDGQGERSAEAGGIDKRQDKPRAETAITQMIEGVMELDRLDVLAQAALSDMTRVLLEGYLRPEWFRTPVVMALACQYFPDLGVGKDTGDIFERLSIFLTGAHHNIREYFAYVLLDLALADPDLEDVPLGHALDLAETLGLTPVLELIVKKEMTYSDKQWDRVKLNIPRQR